MWGAILSKWARETGGNEPIPPELVPMMMVALKISRQIHRHKMDNIDDGVGYWLTLERVINNV